MDKYGLIGFPLGHSFSKNYFNEKFENEGIKKVGFEKTKFTRLTFRICKLYFANK